MSRDAGRVVRPGADRRDVHRRGRGGRDRQRQHLRAGRRGVDPGRRQGRAGRGPAADGHGLDQRLPPVRPAGRVGRLQAVRRRPRARPGRARGVPRDQARLAQHPARGPALVRGRREARRPRPRTTSSSSVAARPAARWPTGSRADPATSVLVLEAGHSDWKIDPFIHMPAALPFPIGSRFYDWRYETEPEPAHGRPPGLPRPRQGARRVAQHQRDDLPARQPDGLRALGGRARAWRSGTTPTACRTSSGWRPASPAPTTGAAATARWSSSAARPRTRCSARSSRPRRRPATR